MTHDPPVGFGNKGNIRLGFSAKPVDEVRLGRRFELSSIERVHGAMIVISFGADQHGNVQTQHEAVERPEP